ncbi:hypothetical protein [Plantibacter sp. RU18]|uniref:hypothetical protein n=1 Tax=Plantibacter sp. RU18 TaxID=3158143 RepID=UPI003D36D005
MTTTGPTPEKAWYEKPWFIVAGAFLALLIVLCLVIVFVVPSPEKVTSAPTSAAATPKPTATAVDPVNADESVCGLPAGDQDVPKTAPTTVWKEFGTATVPFSPDTFGPGAVVAEDVPTCFAHNPTGALYAAGTISGLVIAQEFAAVADHLAAPGPGLDKVRDSPTADVSGSLAGYQYLSYNDDLAVISIAFAAANGAYVAWPMTLEWIDGDWKVQIPDDGNAPFSQLDNLNQFEGWSGV